MTKKKPKWKCKWSCQDDVETFKQGYGIFRRSDTGDLELCALDDPRGVAQDFNITIEHEFQGRDRDRLAAEHVKKLAANGDPTARKVIEHLIAHNSPDVVLWNLTRSW